jgi:hypothetical protein
MRRELHNVRTMSYEYSGYLSTVLRKPDTTAIESMDSVVFDRADLAKWRTEDSPQSLEWRHIPVRKIHTDEGIKLEGDFTGVVNIDSLNPNDPRYWVPLTTFGLTDTRFPVDAARFPIIEVTYRCTSERAHPTWMWTYEGGSHFGALPKSKTWHTVARNVQHFGFPPRIDNVVLRLYSPTRTVESMEIKSVRFRAMTAEEADTIRRSLEGLEAMRPPRRFRVLDEFLPLGVYMDAESASRLAKMLQISEGEYWSLVVEDIVRHGHNVIALANFDGMDRRERDGLLKRCEENGLRLVPRHEYPLAGDAKAQQRVIDEHIKPNATSKAIFARTLSGEPIENDFHEVLESKRRIEEADPDHPVAIIARYPNALPLFAPFFSASGIGYFTSKRPWDAGKSVRTHVPLAGGQQFWLAAPAFMYPTQTPQWSTSPEMRLMANLAFANGARGWFAYSYHNEPVWMRGRLQRSLTGPFLTFSDLWSELMLRMRWIDALAPLLLHARIEDLMDDWFLKGVSTSSTVRPAPGIAPISQFHLRGDDFSLYFTVSNNTREIASIEIDIPRRESGGPQIYDLSDFVSGRQWKPIVRQRHVEMFPGQAHILLVAQQERCDEWRERITARMIDSTHRTLRCNVDLARAYGLDIGEIETSLASLNGSPDPAHLELVHLAKDRLTDLLYGSDAVREARSDIIASSAAVCGCDGALCRLMELGQRQAAMEIGTEVIPLAAEFTRLRLELQRGKGAEIAAAARENAARCLELLHRIRSHY